ncbi:DinB family protein [Paucisalibacillus globulus]|uniref:DinB family protein n=1 Tax=Paucisalibacillus globulus TaxID=351095 RepID=UPI000410EB92|nr:DinB family protein [Paucisalibacillus globulus]
MNKTLNSFNKIIDEIKNLKEVEVAYLTEPISEGKWSIREIIGHIYYWDKFNLEVMVPKMVNGGILPEFPNHDLHNAEGVQYLRGQSVESIISIFIETRKILVEHLTNVSEETRFRIGKGKRQYSVETFTKIFLNHDLYHLKQINEKLNK